MTSLLPFPVLQFFDNNGRVLASGTVTTLIPGTSTPKDTWSDAAGTVLNTNPIVLDSGRATIYGAGSYRFIVADALGNIITDSETAAYIGESSISNVMLPITSAASLATARSLLGVDSAISSAVAAVNLITGPTGPTSTVPGPTGPTGPAGSSGGGPGSVDRQTFLASGTWNKPALSFCCVQMWGAGGGASDSGSGIGGAGGGGGYSAICCLLSDVASTVPVTVGAGGTFRSGSLIGGDGGMTSFGSYLQQTGGKGGNADTNGAVGYLWAYAGINIVFGASQQFLPSDVQTDAYGNPANNSPFSGTSGASGDAPTVWRSVFGGSGGSYPGGNGASPGGGGGTNGGSGGAGLVIITCW